MSFVVSPTDLGTSEAEWLASPELAACAPLVWQHMFKPGAHRVVVIAPHPDDEVLGVGGAMHVLADTLGYTMRVVAVTDGEASHPRSPTLSPAALAGRRSAERADALEELRIFRAEIVRLGLPDGGVICTPDLVARLAREIDGAALCLAPWERDGHPDHDAVGEASRQACESVGVRRLAYPVWAWHWASPTAGDFPWARARRLQLDRATSDAKGAAIASYTSQIAPLSPAPGDEVVLPPEVLARFRRPFEIVLT